MFFDETTFQSPLEEAVMLAARKVEVVDDLNVDALRAAVRALEAGFLDSGQFFLLKIAENVKKEIRKLEAVK